MRFGAQNCNSPTPQHTNTHTNPFRQMLSKELYQAGWWGPAESTPPMGPSFIARAPPGGNKTLLIEWQLLLKSMLTTRVARGEADQLQAPSNGRRRQIGWKCFRQWHGGEAALHRVASVRATEDKSLSFLSKNRIRLAQSQQQSWRVIIICVNNNEKYICHIGSDKAVKTTLVCLRLSKGFYSSGWLKKERCAYLFYTGKKLIFFF